MENVAERINKSELIYSKNQYMGDFSNQIFVERFGDTPILLSAPHATKQMRKGQLKLQEFNTGAITMELAKELNCYFISKNYSLPNNLEDDTNSEKNCIYKRELSTFLKDNKINFFVDFHGMSSNRDSIIDICVNSEININYNKSDVNLKNIIDSSFGKESASIDKYFRAKTDTVLSNWVHTNHNIPSLEIEINGKYRWFESECLKDSIKLFDNFLIWLKNQEK